MRTRTWGEALTAYLYLLPSTVIFGIFTVGPALFVLYISLFHWDFLNTALSHWVGLQNYRDLLNSPTFWGSMLVSFYFVLGTVPVQVMLALFLAVLLSTRFFGQSFARLSVFSPYVTPVVATSIVWIWMFNPQFGLLNAILAALHLPPLGWLQSTTWALPGVILYTLWHSLGFNVIIFLAGLTGISGEIREAARIDGAGAWAEFWQVTLPLISPTTLFVLVISTIGSLQAFTQFYTMTAGGPLSSTTTTSFYLYELAFIFYHTGHAAAVAVALFLVIAIFTALQMGISQKRTFYQ